MKRKIIAAAAAILAVCLLLTACGAGAGGAENGESRGAEIGGKRDLTLAENEPDTVDPQCTSEYYTVALNVFDRLVEVRTGKDGSGVIMPSLAESWEISQEGYVYTFRLRRDVCFSNGAPLTASDVRYTLMRLLTHPASRHSDLAADIFGAAAYRAGVVSTLAGFNIHNDYEFAIVLSRPNASFLAELSSPAASILDEETTEEAGGRFGRNADCTVGTGPFVLERWDAGEEMRLRANPDCWSGAPRCDGVTVKFVADADLQSLMFREGMLDILDLDHLDTEAEYYIHGDVYQDRLYHAQRVGIAYIALNESVPPLDDVRVRRALQLALDRRTMLAALLGGRGSLENGVFPHGLTGFNAELPEIPFDRDEARRLLAEAGVDENYVLELSVPSDASAAKYDLVKMTAAMWRKAGMRVRVVTLDPETFEQRRSAGQLACYYGRWSADYNDPYHFINTFFGSEENSRSRSICYGDEEVMRRIQAARGLESESERLREYRALERRIVQADAAWIPLFSQQHYFVVNERVNGFRISWNGWPDNSYRDVSVLQ